MYRIHGFFTQNTLKTLYCLEEMGVDFEFRYVDLAKGANRTAEFREMTPAGRVPVLEHDGQFLFESGPICRYVATAEHSPLFPADKLERARVDQWMTFWTCHPGRWLNTLFFEKLVKPMAGWGEPDAGRCAEAEKFAGQQIQVLEDWLDGRDWLANDAFSLAEPFGLAYLEQSRYVDFSLDGFPRVKSWFERLEAREAVERARARIRDYARPMMKI